jgi:alkylation response protein AidB-like acyl-CoA dehydrogenase
VTDEAIERPEVHKYRLKARAWLAENLFRFTDSATGEDDDPGPVAIAEGRAIQQKLYAAGYAGFTFPVEYGGQGLTLEHERVFQEEARGYRTPPTNFGVSINIIGASLAAFASHEQKLEYIPDILSGKKLWLQFLSEPSGGSDLAGLLTSATRDGESFIVNGQKTWSTGAHVSDFALCPVRTRWDVPKHKGISVLIMDLRSPGIEIRRIKQINGDADFCEEFFTDVMVPLNNLVGEENEGWRVARGLLAIEHAWVGRGGSKTTYPTDSGPLVKLAKERGLGQDRGIRRQVVSIHVGAAVQDLLSARVADATASGKLPPGYGSLLKLGNDILVQRRAELLLSLAGAGGVTWRPGDPGTDEWARQFLKSRSASIAGGTAEIQRNNVSERVLGLPREPTFDRDIPFNQVPHN